MLWRGGKSENWACLQTYTSHSRPDNLKKSKPKNSWNQINQFHGIVWGYFPFSESKIWTENILKKRVFFRDIDLFDFTSFFTWIFFFNFMAYCASINWWKFLAGTFTSILYRGWNWMAYPLQYFKNKKLSKKKILKFFREINFTKIS